MVRVGIVGAGVIAREHMKVIDASPDARLVAVCDVVQESAEKAADQFGAKAYMDYKAMLEQETLDALFLCVPPYAHGDMEETAAERGIHLLVEKPLGLDLVTVKRKAEVLRRSGVIVGTGYCLRYAHAVEKAREYLAGKPISMVRAYRFGGFYGPLWWRDMSKSGGQLVEQTTHNVDLMVYLAGAIKKVSADAALTLLGDTPGISIPDVTSANLVFESGAIGHIDTGFIPQPDHRSSLEFMGENFRVTLDGFSKLTIAEKGRTIVQDLGNDFYKAQDEAFFQAILTGDRTLIRAPYDEAVKTLEVTLAANESVATGNSVWLS